MESIMKRAGRVLSAIHTLPEEGRRLLALISMVVMAVLLFSFWSFMTSSRLAQLSEPQTVDGAQSDVAAAVIDDSALTPVSGIAESLKSFAALLKPVEDETVQSVGERIKSLENFIADMWQRLYDMIARLPLHE